MSRKEERSSAISDSSSMGRELFPEIEPFESFHINADGLHSVYVEVTGNPDGVPVVFLHGGPGSGCNENHRRYFDPARYRIVIFDQRGCNRSTPQGECRNNTTTDLLGDMEKIRTRLGICKWLLFGGSWGATLALSYAETHPDRVAGMILRGTFLARDKDLEWFAGAGVAGIFPEYWQEFIADIPVGERNDLVGAYHRRVHGEDPGIRRSAAVAWAKWAGRIVTWTLAGVDPGTYSPEDSSNTVNEVRIETHYAQNRYFLEPDQLLKNVNRLPDVPITIIHGRRDITCLPVSSWELHRAVPSSTLTVLPEAGHLAGEPPMIDALVNATDRMADLLNNG